MGKPTKEALLAGVDACLLWIENQMLSFGRGSVGVYERLRIDIGRRVAWTRPDCNAEIARVLYRRNRADQKDIYENIVSWLLSTRDTDKESRWFGSFPFYLVDGEPLGGLSGSARFQNDNGKVLIALLDLYEKTGEDRFRQAAIDLADYWVSIQTPEGFYYRNDGGVTQSLYEGPCFLFWLACGISGVYALTEEAKYKESVQKALSWLLPLQKENGRFTTTYERMKSEDWRPPSSETAIAVFCLARMQKWMPDLDLEEPLLRAAGWLCRMQHPCGGIMGSDEESLPASLQTDPALCDLVYTQGFALMGLCELYSLTKEELYRTAAEDLADFLLRIQCKNESPFWDGAWRGSYHPDKEIWDGRANQNNEIDEGGMYSIYTGWCASTIMDGLLSVADWQD